MQWPHPPVVRGRVALVAISPGDTGEGIVRLLGGTEESSYHPETAGMSQEWLSFRIEAPRFSSLGSLSSSSHHPGMAAGIPELLYITWRTGEEFGIHLLRMLERYWNREWGKSYYKLVAMNCMSFAARGLGGCRASQSGHVAGWQERDQG